MTPKERQHLQKLDDLVLNASPEELENLQKADFQTQLEGLSFYDVYVNSEAIVHQSMPKKSQDSKK